MVLHFPSDIGVKTLALLRGKRSKNSQQNSAALTQPTCQQFGPFTKKLFSKPWDFCCSPKPGCSPERDTALGGLRFQPSLPALWRCKYKYDVVQNIPNLATVMFNLWSNCWLKDSTRVGARDEQASENQNELKNSCCNTEHRNLQRRPERPSLHYFHFNVQQKLSKIKRFCYKYQMKRQKSSKICQVTLEIIASAEHKSFHHQFGWFGKF